MSYRDIANKRGITLPNLVNMAQAPHVQPAPSPAGASYATGPMTTVPPAPRRARWTAGQRVWFAFLMMSLIVLIPIGFRSVANVVDLVQASIPPETIYDLPPGESAIVDGLEFTALAIPSDPGVYEMPDGRLCLIAGATFEDVAANAKTGNVIRCEDPAQ